MKRGIITLLAVLFLAFPAQARTREAVYTAEGEEETVVETLYRSSLGFSFWYDADLFRVDETMSEDGLSLIVFPKSGDLPVYLEIMLPESQGVLPWKYLELNSEPGTEYTFEELESGADLHWFSKPEGDMVHCFYAVDTNETFVLCSLAAPPEVEETLMGSGFHSLIRSLALGKDMEADTEDASGNDSSAQADPAEEFPQKEEIPAQKILLADYFEREITEDESPYFEAVLYSYSDTQALMEIYTAGGTDHEKMTACLVPLETVDQLMEVICTYGMNGWNSREGSGISGKLYVCKFREGGSLVRVSSENMPDDGLEAFDAVWEVMEKARLNAVPLP